MERAAWWFVVAMPEVLADMMHPVETAEDSIVRRGDVADIEPAVSVAIAAGIWDPADTAPVHELLGSACAPDHGPIWHVAVQAGMVTGTACAQVVVGTDRTWDLTMIAVGPDVQGRGVGSTLIRAVEDAIRDAGGRLLVVETSSSSAQDPAREFYVARSYEEVGRVRDYWEDGEDLVIFWKRLI